MRKSTAYKSSGTAPSLFPTPTKFETKTCKVRNEELPSFIRFLCSSVLKHPFKAKGGELIDCELSPILFRDFVF